MQQRENEMAKAKKRITLPIEYYINEHKYKPKTTIKTKNNEQNSIDRT